MTESNAGALLREVARLYTRAQRVVADCCRTTSTQCHLLTELARSGPLPLSDLGAHRSLDGSAVREGLQPAFLALAEDMHAWRDMSAAAAKVCDGLGAQRTAERFIALISPRFGNNHATLT